MKKFVLILILVLMLTGCGAQETFETVGDVYDVNASTVLYEVQLSLPEDALLSAMEAEDGSKIYLCDNYTVMVQTMAAGDFDRTVKELSGFSREDLTVMQTAENGVKKYETVWCATGEGEDQVCRSVILDDGNYHYCVTVMANYSLVSDLQTQWQHILDSAILVSTD